MTRCFMKEGWRNEFLFRQRLHTTYTYIQSVLFLISKGITNRERIPSKLRARCCSSLADEKFPAFWSVTPSEVKTSDIHRRRPDRRFSEARNEIFLLRKILRKTPEGIFFRNNRNRFFPEGRQFLVRNKCTEQVSSFISQTKRETELGYFPGTKYSIVHITEVRKVTFLGKSWKISPSRSDFLPYAKNTFFVGTKGEDFNHPLFRK